MNSIITSDVLAELEAREREYFAYKASKMETLENEALKAVSLALHAGVYHSIKASFYDDCDGSSVKVEVKETHDSDYIPHEELERDESSNELEDLERLLECFQHYLEFNGVDIEVAKDDGALL
ncbi:MAG: hypothetical protein EOP04_03715 [Proteobacteria bacterium]|nr:MAG: hypothetical protein EOP04_03715 [Pseudomonadota bacterium]